MEEVVHPDQSEAASGSQAVSRHQSDSESESEPSVPVITFRRARAIRAPKRLDPSDVSTFLVIETFDPQEHTPKKKTVVQKKKAQVAKNRVKT